MTVAVSALLRTVPFLLLFWLARFVPVPADVVGENVVLGLLVFTLTAVYGAVWAAIDATRMRVGRALRVWGLTALLVGLEQPLLGRLDGGGRYGLAQVRTDLVNLSMFMAVLVLLFTMLPVLVVDRVATGRRQARAAAAATSTQRAPRPARAAQPGAMQDPTEVLPAVADGPSATNGEPTRELEPVGTTADPTLVLEPMAAAEAIPTVDTVLPPLPVPPAPAELESALRPRRGRHAARLVPASDAPTALPAPASRPGRHAGGTGRHAAVATGDGHPTRTGGRHAAAPAGRHAAPTAPDEERPRARAGAGAI